MKYLNNKVSNLLDQIRQVDNMILLHKNNGDEVMIRQYQARKLDYLKELVYELINLSAGSPRIYETIKSIIAKIESTTPLVTEKEISRQFKFSLTELETVLAR
jgi:hypothetical protein